MSINSDLFKAAMSNLVSGVSIVCTKDNNNFFGLTISSLTSLSLNPHLLLFCIKSNSLTLSALRSSKTFSVNILNEDQEDISRLFASSSKNKFDGLNFSIGKISECPILNDANSIIECSLYKEYEGGDHHIIIGLVENIILDSNKLPLAYYKRDYRKISTDKMK